VGPHHAGDACNQRLLWHEAFPTMSRRALREQQVNIDPTCPAFTAGVSIPGRLLGGKRAISALGQTGG
jgi:hypothetical protein